MSRTYNSLEEYVAAVEKKIPAAAGKYVAPYLMDTLRQYIWKNVYQAYSPKPGAWLNGTTYKRRYALLEGIDAWIDGDELIATSIAAPSRSIAGSTVYGGSNGGFLTMLASGKTGLWKSGFPRPVVPQAQADVDRNIGDYEKLLVFGLEEMV